MAADLVSMARPGDEVGDAGRRPGLGAARAASGDQDRRHGARRGRSSSACPRTSSTRPNTRAGRPDLDPRHARSSRSPGSSPRRPTLLAGAERPMIIMGDGIAMSGAQAELTRVAELLGAEVWGANSSEVNIDDAHPLFRGNLGHMFGHHSRPLVGTADAVLIVGTYVFPEVFPSLTERLRAGRADRPRRPRRLRDRQELPGRPRHRQPTRSSTLAALAVALGQQADAGRRARPPRPGSRRAPAAREQADARRCATPTSRRAGGPAPRLGVHGGPGGPAARRRDHLRRGAHVLAGGDPVPAAAPARLVLPDPRRLARRRHPGRHRRQAGAPGPDGRRASPATAAACTRSRRCGRRPTTASAPSS